MVSHSKFMMSQILLPSTGKGKRQKKHKQRSQNGASSGMFTAEATTTTLNNEDGIASFLWPLKIKKRDKAYLSLNPKYQKSSRKAENMVVVLPVHGQTIKTFNYPFVS